MIDLWTPGEINLSSGVEACRYGKVTLPPGIAALRPPVAPPIAACPAAPPRRSLAFSPALVGALRLEP